MVNWETQVYSKTGEDLCGVEVIAKDDVGEIIDTLQVLNKTEFEALVTDLNSKLDVLDETYVRFSDGSVISGRTIEEILTNSSDDISINATTLEGVNASNFSRTGHTHTKTEITNLLNYKISANKYNVDIGDSVIISVNVTDQAGRPVASSPVIITKNGESWASGNTNSSGVFTSTFTTTDWGLINFGVNTSNIQVVVKGWKTESLHSTMELKYNEDSVMLKIASSRMDYPTSLTPFQDVSVPSGLRPSMPVSAVLPDINALVVVKEDGSVNRRKFTGSAGNYSCYILLSWHY